MIRRIYAVLFAVVLGCGSGGPTRSASELEQAKQAVQAALDNWQKNELETKLGSANPPIKFAEDHRKTRILLEYEIGASSVPDTRTISFTVRLKTRDKKNKEETLPVVYLVELGPPIRVTRDPYN